MSIGNEPIAPPINIVFTGATKDQLAMLANCPRGMTLRQYYIGQAITGLLANNLPTIDWGWAIEIADLILAKLEQEKSNDATERH